MSEAMSVQNENVAPARRSSAQPRSVLFDKAWRLFHKSVTESDSLERHLLSSMNKSDNPQIRDNAEQLVKDIKNIWANRARDEIEEVLHAEEVMSKLDNLDKLVAEANALGNNKPAWRPTTASACLQPHITQKQIMLTEELEELTAEKQKEISELESELSCVEDGLVQLKELNNENNVQLQNIIPH